MSTLDVFSKFQPGLTLIKSDDDTYKIEGIATTEHEDSHGEIIKQDGLDFSYCLKSGCLNYDHKNEPKYILGAPTEVNRVVHNGKPATAVKGILYSQKQIVKDLVENFKVMKDAGGVRKLGFSIEGQVLSRDKKNPNIITRAKVLNISLTHNPANTEATIALVKNILSDMEDKENMPEEINKSEDDDLPMTYRQSKLLEDYSMKLCQLLKSLPMDADLPEWCQSKITKALDYIQAAYHYMDVEMGEDMDKAKVEYEEDESAESKARKLLELHPELLDPELMAEIHRLMSKDVSPEYLNNLKEEAVVAPEAAPVPSMDRDNDYPQSFEMNKGYKSDEEMDKMDRKELYEYARFLEGLMKEQDEDEDAEKMSDLSALQTESLEGAGPEPEPKELASADMNIGMPEDEEDDMDKEQDELNADELKDLIEGLLRLGMDVKVIKEYIDKYSH